MKLTVTKILLTGIAATAVLLAAGIPSAMAEEEAPSADASIGFYSKYVWRGFELSKDSIVIQPSLTASYKGFSANIWANLDTDAYGSDPAVVDVVKDSKNWNETDLTLSYDGAFEKIGYGLGWIYYALEGVEHIEDPDPDLDRVVVANDTQEFYATVSYDTILSPSLTLYYDIDEFSGDWYANLAIGHSFMIAENYSLDLGLSVGYYFIDGGAPSDSGEDYSEFHDGLLSASMSFPINEYFTITPELYWSFALSNEASDAIETGPSNEDNFVYGGISASFSF